MFPTLLQEIKSLEVKLEVKTDAIALCISMLEEKTEALEGKMKTATSNVQDIQKDTDLRLF